MIQKTAKTQMRIREIIDSDSFEKKRGFELAAGMIVDQVHILFRDLYTESNKFTIPAETLLKNGGLPDMRLIVNWVDNETSGLLNEKTQTRKLIHMLKMYLHS